MSNTFTTPKGTVLPLTNLKGKDYLMVAYRIQWFNEEVPNFNIETNFLLLNETETIAHATVVLYDKEGKFIKKATATKRETKQDFSDHTEKAETSAVGRALAMLGYGTQFALADLDEGQRLADSPLVKSEAKGKPVTKSSFRKPTIAKAEQTSNSPPTSTEAPTGSSETTGWE